jgi:RNA polymerase I-specific transcription initiation factor RRN3
VIFLVITSIGPLLMMGKVRLLSGRLEDCPVVNREVLISRVHMALKYLLRLIPSASGTLAPILSSKFPFSEETKKVHMSYINSLIRVIEYAPELKAEIFALITERLVKIDVQMQTDLDDLDDEVAAAIVQAISLQPDRIDEDDDMDDEDSDTDSVTSDESLDDEASRIKEVQGNVEKMDAILDTLFSIYNPYFSDPNSLLAQSMFDTLLSHFRNIILPTYRSRHTQFLLFHFAQTSEHLVDTFAGECVELAFKSGRAAVLKQSAAAYLASFVARGARVPPHVVRDVFDYIGTCLDTIRDENEQTCRGPDLQRYGTFYATTQALLYIFCFRWRDLLVSSDGDDDVFDEDDPAALRHLEWHAGVKELLTKTILSKLNPLKICAPPIVEEFAKIANKLEFMQVYPLLAANKRIRLSQYTLGAGGNGVLRESAFANGRKTDSEEESWHMLDAYFPFDPYQLPVSRRWIASDYVEWKGIPGEEDRDDSTNGEDEEDGGVDLEDELVDTATEDDEETT